MSDRDIINAVRSFPAGSAGGPDGITPQHLKDLFATVTDGRLPTQIVQFVNFLLNGGLSQQIIEIIFGANLIALQKIRRCEAYRCWIYVVPPGGQMCQLICSV